MKAQDIPIKTANDMRPTSYENMYTATEWSLW